MCHVDTYNVIVAVGRFVLFLKLIKDKMSKLCSLPWCRKPIFNKKQGKNFPSDRPSQLAWLDALDAGTWFSIPQETLATGLILCCDHFDAKGNVKRRYDNSPIVNEEYANNGSDSDSSNSAAAKDDQDASPPRRSSRNSNSKKSSSKQIRVNVINSRKRRKSKIVTNDDSDASTNDAIIPSASSQSSKQTNTKLDSIDTRRLTKLTEDAINSSRKYKESGQPVTRKSISLKQKMEIIRLSDNGMKQSEIATQMDLGKSTIWCTLSNREKIEKAYNDGAPLRRKIRRGTYDDVNHTLYAWYQKVKSQNLFVNTRVLLTMAENIARELGRTEFKSSQGWLEKFKTRYNIRFGNATLKAKKARTSKLTKNSEDLEQDVVQEDIMLKVKLEAGDDGLEPVTRFDEFTEDSEFRKQNWLETTWSKCRVKCTKSQERYQDKDIFAAEEVSVLYRITPKQAWQFRSNSSSVSDFSIVEERLTTLLCCNSDGSEKRRLLVAGGNESIFHKNLPADYVVTDDPSSWLTKKIFRKWLRKWNAALESEGRKIVLLVSSTPLHKVKDVDTPNIKVVRIPAQALIELLPINQHIRTGLRARYRRLLLEKIVDEQSSDFQVSRKDALSLLSIAWNELPIGMIRNSFTTSGYLQGSVPSEIEDTLDENFDCSNLLAKVAEMRLAVAQTKYSFRDYVGIDDSLCAVDCSLVLSGDVEEPDESSGQVTDTEEDELEGVLTGSESQSEQSSTRSNATPADALNYVKELRAWVMSRPSCPQEIHNSLNTLESFILGHTP